MLNHISPFVYTAICNYVEQNELIDTLYNKGFINDSDMYLPYYDDEDAEDNQYADFDTWITFSDIEKIIDLDILIEK
jgi:predicted transcriptional regulator